MATITISPAGGNWNSTATWIGGVVPTQADDIIGNASSGSLTINVAQANCRFATFTGYTGTLDIQGTNQFRIIGITTTTTILGAGMTITGTGFFRIGSGNIQTNGVLIPNFEPTFANTTTTLLDNLNCTTLYQRLGNVTKTINGFQINAANFVSNAFDAGANNRWSGTTVINMTGTNCTWDASAVASSEANVRNPVTINCSGNFTITGFMNLAQGTTLNVISGNVIGDKNIRFFNPTTSSGFTTILNTPSVSWDSIWISNQAQSLNLTDTYQLNADLEFSQLTICNLPHGSAAQQVKTIAFTGSGTLKGGTFSAYASNLITTGNALNSAYVPKVSFSSGSSHTFSGINITGITQSCPGTFTGLAPDGTSINLTGSQNILFTTFTRVNATGNTIYTYQGSQSLSTNVEVANNYLPTQAYSFVN